MNCVFSVVFYVVQNNLSLNSVLHFKFKMKEEKDQTTTVYLLQNHDVGFIDVGFNGFNKSKKNTNLKHEIQKFYKKCQNNLFTSLLSIGKVWQFMFGFGVFF